MDLPVSLEERENEEILVFQDVLLQKDPLVCQELLVHQDQEDPLDLLAQEPEREYLEYLE